jgi:inner membrane transporter RhtA
MSDQTRGVALVVAAVTSLQFGAGFAVTLFDELGPAGAACLRLVIAAVILLAVWRPRLRGRTLREIRLAGAYGMTLGVMNLCIYEAMDRIPLGIAITIEFWGPLAVAVLGSRRPLDLLWVGLAAVGIVLLADLGSGSLDTGGVLFAAAAGGLWAIYILLAARVGQVFPGGSGLALAMIFGAIVTLPAGIVAAGDALLAPALIAAATVVAIASSVIPYSFELEALRLLPARVFGVLMSLEPAVAALAGLIVLGQSLGAREWLAIALVAAASAGATALSRTPQPRD